MLPAVVLTNRRDLYLPGTLASLAGQVAGVGQTVIVDDSGDEAWRDRLRASHRVVPVAPEPAGYTRAMQTVWSVCRSLAGPVFLVEEDWAFLRRVDLARLADVLNEHRNMAQVALLREPWYPIEKRLGLIQAQRRRVDRDHARRHLLRTRWWTHPWGVEHTAGITCNPALWSPRAFEHDWPDEPWSEGVMGERLVAAGMTSGWYGREPYTRHTGAERAKHSAGY